VGPRSAGGGAEFATGKREWGDLSPYRGETPYIASLEGGGNIFPYLKKQDCERKGELLRPKRGGKEKRKVGGGKARP